MSVVPIRSRDNHVLSSSPLARPRSLLHQLAAELQDYIYLPDPNALYMVLGTVAANMVKGEPYWLMLVGAPSSGKTLLILALTEIPGIHQVEDLSGKGALLSGTKKSEMGKDATGGLLREVGPSGMIVMDDYTSSVMGLARDTRKEVLNAFRGVYKGRWSRHIGTDGAKRLLWEGKIGMIAGGTPVIDRQNLESGELGERWTYFRLPPGDRFGSAKKRLQDSDPQEAAKRTKAAIRSFFEMMDFGWPCWMEKGKDDVYRCKTTCHEPGPHEKREEKTRREFRTEEWVRLIGLGDIFSRMRSAVYRNSFSRDIEDAPILEEPTRLAAEFGQIYLGLEQIGLNESERWPLVRKVAFDSVPSLRGTIVEACLRLEENNTNGVRPGIGYKELKVLMRCSDSTVKRTVEDLEVHGIVEVASHHKTNATEVRLSERTIEEMRRHK